jgi:hypothetical protein
MLGASELHLDTRSVIGIEQRSRIVLNIHREDVKFFEWHRIVMHGIWQGALVVSEPCSAAPPFRPGIDYVETSLDRLGEQLSYYLGDPRGQLEAQAIADAGFRTLTRECRMRDALERLLAHIAVVPGGRS